MIAAVVTPSGLADETEASRIVSTPLQWLAQPLFLLAFGDIFVVEIALFQVPDGRPAVMRQVGLVLRVQRLENLWCFSTQRIVVGRQVS